MAEDFKPNWDTKRHDDGIPHHDQPVTLTCPKCNGRYLIQLVVLDRIDSGTNRVKINASVVAFACASCNHVTKMEDLVSVREGANVVPFEPPKKA